MGINKNINDYITRTGTSRETVNQALSLIMNADLNHSSIFSVDSDGLDREEFCQALAELTNKDPDDIETYANIIFDVYNSSDNDYDDVLTISELGTLVQKDSSTGKYKMKASYLTGAFQYATVLGTSRSSSSSAGSGYSSPVGSDYSSTVRNWRKDIEDIINTSDTDDYECPEDVISEILASGAIDETLANEIRASYTKYSENEENDIAAELKILKMTNPEATRADAIQSLQNKDKLTEPIITAESPLGLSGKVNIETVADEIYKAIDGKNNGMLEEIIGNLFTDLSDRDVVEIVKKYNEKYGQKSGGLVAAIEKATSGKKNLETQIALTTFLAHRLAVAANNGTSGAINVITQEVRNGLQGSSGKYFREAIFASPDQGCGLNDALIKKLYKNYNEVYNRNLIDDIHEKYTIRGFFGGYKGIEDSGQNIINRIEICNLVNK